MKKTLRIAVAIASLVVAVLVISMVVLRIDRAKTSGERSSGAEYSILRNVFIGIQNQGDLQDSFIRNRLIAIYKNSERMLAAQVLDRSGMVAWKIPADSPYFALPNDPSSRAGFTAPESSTVIFSTPLNDGMKLLALYTSLRRSDISSAIKPSLILAIIWLIVTFLALFILSREGETPKTNKKISRIDTFSTAPGAPSEPDVPVLAEPASTGTATDGSASDESEPNESASAETSYQANEVDSYTEDKEQPSGSEESDEDSEFLEDEELMDEESNTESEEQGESETNGEEIDEFLDAEEAIELIESKKPAQELELKQEKEPIPDNKEKPSNKSFEESLTKLEKEIAMWTARQKEPKPIPPLETKELNTVKEVKAVQPAKELNTVKEVKAVQPAKELNTVKEVKEVEAVQPAIVASEKKPETSHEPVLEKTDLLQLPLPLSLQDTALEKKLSEELVRNVSDIALMLIHCSIGSPGDPIAIAMSVTIKDYIGSKDLVFELYRGAYAIVLPSVDLGGALKMSEDLADVLSTTFSLYKDVEASAPIFIGISARADRMIDSYKIYREASTAVHKAFSGGRSRILAFRPKA
jgi:hypothetical protein